ncbi:MAG: epsilon-lactone hydrolase [Actinomycetota bacterium]|jgi:acetyl esterase/lipase
MASEEMRNLAELIRSAPVLTGAPVEQLRANMEAMATVVPPPADVAYESVDAGGVPAEWVTAPGARTDAVILYLHGGGYAIGSINTHRMLAANISRAAGLRVLLIDYRLAPEHPHPAAVEDATAAYRWLLSQGIDAAKLAISGDSAGGGLTVATLLALRDAGDPLPACAAPMSPWVDMEQSAESYTTRGELDPMVSAVGLKEMADWYLAGQDTRTPYASPVHADLKGLPPMLVQVGDHEVLLDDAITLVERINDAGGDAMCEVGEECFHVYQAFPVPEATEAIARLAAFVTSHISS